MTKPNVKSWYAAVSGSVAGWTRDLSHRSLAVCLAVGVFAALVLVFKPPLIYQLLWEQEVHLQDRFFAWRNALGPALGYRGPSRSDIVIVSIDNDSARRLGLYPPWPRQLYAALIKQLKDAGAAAVAFDVMLDGPSPLSDSSSPGLFAKLKQLVPPGSLPGWQATAAGDDRELAAELKAAGNAVLATNVQVSLNLFEGRHRYSFQSPYEPLIEALSNDLSLLGNVGVEPDSDGLVRRASLIFPQFEPGSPFYYSFALKSAEKYWQSRGVLDSQGRIFLHGRYYPTSFKINFVGPAGSFRVVPFWKALSWERHYGKEAPLSGNLESAAAEAGDFQAGNPFKSKIVLVGYHYYLTDEQDIGTAPLGQERSLPFNSFLTPTAGITRPMSGVELQANVVSNLLSGRYINEPEWWEHVLIVMFVALLFARIFSGLHGRPWSMLGAVACFAAIWFIDAFLCFVYLECAIPVIVPVFGVALPAYFLVLTDQNLFAFRERRKHTKIFRNLAPARLAEEIDRRQLGELGLEGKTARVTLLVCQLQEFAAATEDRPPGTIIQMLNECLSVMVAAIYEHSGIVDRVLNYGVIGLWGAPLSMQETSQARLAAGCALQIQERLEDLWQRWEREGLLPAGRAGLDCRYGINTGEASCGRIGAEARTEYGAVGKIVDACLIFEGMSKRYGVRSVVGESTAQLISQQFAVRELDKVRLSLPARPQHIYELICAQDKLPGAMEEAAAVYRQGLAAMEERNFAEAERLFNTVLRMVPDDKPTMIMLERCREFLASPPAPGWDGATLLVHDE